MTYTCNVKGKACNEQISTYEYKVLSLRMKTYQNLMLKYQNRNVSYNSNANALSACNLRVST